MIRTVGLLSVAVLGLSVAGCANEQPAAAYDLGLNPRPMSTATASNAAIGPMDQRTLVPADLNGAGVPVAVGPGQVYKMQ